MTTKDTADKIKALIARGESSTLEFKECQEGISGSVYETVCSFLNRRGGIIILGVADDGEILGVPKNAVVDRVKNIINSTNDRNLFAPTLYLEPEVIEVEGKMLIVLDVPAGNFAYSYKKLFYDRNGDADQVVQGERLLALFERKNPHLLEERIVEGLTMADIDDTSLTEFRNYLRSVNPQHTWLKMNDEDMLVAAKLARHDEDGIRLKYAALILFGTEDAMADNMPRYRFEALYHNCTWKKFVSNALDVSRYDDRVTLRCNLFNVYQKLMEFVQRYMPDKFYLPEGSVQRVDLRLQIMREVIGNLCVHTDYSSGFACFLDIYNDRAVTRNPTRITPNTTEGSLPIEQLTNYTKNPLLVGTFRQLQWVEDLGSGKVNILKYAPLYYPDFKIFIEDGVQFQFTITYAPESSDVPNSGQVSGTMSGTVRNYEKMTETQHANIARLSDTNPELVQILNLIKRDPTITQAEMAEEIGVAEKTIFRYLAKLKAKNIIRRVGPATFGGKWEIIKNPAAQ